MFSEIEPRGVDQLMALMAAYKTDTRTKKVDLVVGVYKNDSGAVPVMSAVKKAETVSHGTEATKNYEGIAGDTTFGSLVMDMMLGEESPVLAADRARAVQTVGGSGALRVGFALLNAAKPGGTVWMSTPSWANHAPTAQAAGLKVAYYPYFDAETRGLDFPAMMKTLREEAQPGDVVLLHACCHNPTGVDLDDAQWAEVAALFKERKLVPFVDCAYNGLGRSMEEDVKGLRAVVEAVPEALVSTSFSKNFGIYRERTGGLTMIAATPEDADKTFATACALIRSLYSMPPSHGAKIVTTVFGDPTLKAEWAAELDEMRDRIAGVRQTLRQMLEERQVSQDLSFLTAQKGMFSYTGFSADMVKTLREEHGVYMAGDGRMNVAGLCSENLEHVADAFAAVLR